MSRRHAGQVGQMLQGDITRRYWASISVLHAAHDARPERVLRMARRECVEIAAARFGVPTQQMAEEDILGVGRERRIRRSARRRRRSRTRSSDPQVALQPRIHRRRKNSSISEAKERELAFCKTLHARLAGCRYASDSLQPSVTQRTRESAAANVADPIGGRLRTVAPPACRVTVALPDVRKTRMPSSTPPVVREASPSFHFAANRPPSRWSAIR